MSKETFDLILRMRDEASAIWKKTQGSISGGLKNLSSSFMNLRTLIAGAFAVKVVKDFINASNEQEKATAKLSQALRNVGVKNQATLAFMEAYSSQLQKSHGFGDDVITQVQAQIVAMTGLTGKAVQPLVTATLDLAKARNMDALSAADLITKTIAGQDALGRYGISVKHATTSQEKMSEIVRIIREQFGGMAENEVKTAAGQIEQFSLTWGDLQEDIGAVIKKALVPFLNWLNENMPVIKAIVMSMVDGLSSSFNVVAAIFHGLTGDLPAFTQAVDNIKAAGDRIRSVWRDIGQEQKPVSEEGVTSLNEIRKAATAVVDPLKNMQFEMKWIAKEFKAMADAALQSLPTEQIMTWSEMQHAELQKQLGDFQASKLTESEVLEGWYARAREMAQENVFQLEEIDKVYRERKTELDIAAAQKVARQVQQLTSQLTSVLVGFSKNRTDAEIIDLETRRDAQLEAIDAELAKEEITEEQRNLLLDKRKKLENDYQAQIRSAKERQFAAEKTAAVIQSIMQTAVAVVEALPNLPLAIAVGVLGAAQTAVIAGQPTPRFHQGGVVPGPESREMVAVLKGGETVRTAEQERALGGGGITIIQHFNGIVTRDLAEMAKRGVEEVLQRTGLPIDKAFVRNRESLSFG